MGIGASRFSAAVSRDTIVLCRVTLLTLEVAVSTLSADGRRRFEEAGVAAPPDAAIRGRLMTDRRRRPLASHSPSPLPPLTSRVPELDGGTNSGILAGGHLADAGPSIKIKLTKWQRSLTRRPTSAW